VNVTVAPLHSLSAGELAAWREMQRADRSLANPFMAPEFALAVAAVKPQARVAVLRSAGGSEPVGFLPFERGPLGLGRPIGAGVSDAQGVVHRPGASWDHEQLLAACGLAVLEFDHLVDGQFGGSVRRQEPSPVIDLSDGFDAYVEHRREQSRSFRRAMARHQALERDFAGLRFEWHSSAPDAFAALTAWKSAQYRRTGRADRFARPWIRELAQRLMQTRADGFRGVLATLRVDGRPIAVQACLASDSVLALWFPAFDPAFARYSPGNLLRLRLARAAAERGIGLLDFGKGWSAHKELLKTGELRVGEARIERRGARAAVHRLYRDPPRTVERFVLDHPRLRLAARRTLAGMGRARTRLAG